ncbi:MAG: hypothetical protein K6E51_02685 [Treponema sp.]|nr:hypothetical protein [Treponema sp.]
MIGSYFEYKNGLKPITRNAWRWLYKMARSCDTWDCYKDIAYGAIYKGKYKNLTKKHVYHVWREVYGDFPGAI